MIARVAAISFAIAGLGLLACTDRKRDVPRSAPQGVTGQAARTGAKSTSFLRHTAERECAAPIDLTPPREVQVGERVGTHFGYKLTFQDADADGALVLGVLGPVNDDSGANLVAIQAYRRFFAQQGADAIVVTGDVGEQAEGITRVLLALAEAKIPVLVVAGNRECRADFTNGVIEAQQRASNLVNMNQVRAVEFPEATLISLPGYHDPNYLGCATACRYFKNSVDEVIRLAREATTPVVLVSHGPPRGNGPLALDYTFGGGNVGDEEINRAIKEAKIPFGLFSNIKEAGGRATSTADGSAGVGEGEQSERLYLNPGPADTVPWELHDGSYSVGMAAVIRLQSGGATYEVFRAPPPTPAEKELAQALDPPAVAADRETLGTKSAPASLKRGSR